MSQRRRGCRSIQTGTVDPIDRCCVPCSISRTQPADDDAAGWSSRSSGMYRPNGSQVSIRCHRRCAHRCIRLTQRSAAISIRGRRCSSPSPAPRHERFRVGLCRVPDPPRSTGRDAVTERFAYQCSGSNRSVAATDQSRSSILSRSGHARPSVTLRGFQRQLVSCRKHSTLVNPPCCCHV